MDDLQPLLVSRIAFFAQNLRQAHLPADEHAVLLFTRALAELDAVTTESLYWAGRLCFVKRVEDLDTYEREFFAFLNESRRHPVEGSSARAGLSQDRADSCTRIAAHSADDIGHDNRVGTSGALASSVEILRRKSFADVTTEESAHLKRLIAQIKMIPPQRMGRRGRAATSGETLDLGRMLRESVRTEGDPVRRRWQRRTMKPRRLVFLLDISGSMKAYSRSLLQFAYAVRSTHRPTEVFSFGTCLTRLTPHLDAPDVDTAFASAGQAITDWEGGTRISDSLNDFITRWGRRGIARGAVVVIFSDGLERGDPENLGLQMRRLKRLAYSVIWLNPLKGAVDYEPLARGMAAALRSVDVFMSGHNLASLEDLSKTLAGLRNRDVKEQYLETKFKRSTPRLTPGSRSVHS